MCPVLIIRVMGSHECYGYTQDDLSETRWIIPSNNDILMMMHQGSYIVYILKVNHVPGNGLHSYQIDTSVPYSYRPASSESSQVQEPEGMSRLRSIRTTTSNPQIMIIRNTKTLTRPHLCDWWNKTGTRPASPTIDIIAQLDPRFP